MGGKVLYGLYGVVEHSGSMKGGHYTAYVKVRTPSRKLLATEGLAEEGSPAETSFKAVAPHSLDKASTLLASPPGSLVIAFGHKTHTFLYVLFQNHVLQQSDL